MDSQQLEIFKDFLVAASAFGRTREETLKILRVMMGVSDLLPDYPEVKHLPEVKTIVESVVGKSILSKLLVGCMKPEEIASNDSELKHARVIELINWFVRMAEGKGNPEWAIQHGCELAYYLAELKGLE